MDARTSLLHGGRITYLGDPLELSFVDWSSTREEAGVRGEAGLLCGLLSFFGPSLMYLIIDTTRQRILNTFTPPTTVVPVR